jgi:hypothetical protein
MINKAARRAYRFLLRPVVSAVCARANQEDDNAVVLALTRVE